MLSPISSNKVQSMNNKKPSLMMLASEKEMEHVLEQGEEIFFLVAKEGRKVGTANEDPDEEVNVKVEVPIAELLAEFRDVFPINLPPVLPPICSIEH